MPTDVGMEQRDRRSAVAAEPFPLTLTRLIGRDEELANGRALLRDRGVRLLSVTGPPGVGKTRFAVALARDCEDDFGDRGAFVALAAISDARLVVPTLAAQLGLRDAGQARLLERLQHWLAERELLLLVDNFEQVAKTAPVLTELLAAARRLKLLVTSRARLRISGEHELSLEPLTVPDPDGENDPRTLLRHPAVALFCERAQAVSPSFELDGGNAHAVAEICVRLDGLPLAIELAAARMKLLTPLRMRERLEHRLELLTGGPRDLPARQQTLRGTIEWSYELLDEREQELFRRLAAFVGGWTLEAAEALWQREETVDVLGSLVDESLVRSVNPSGEEGRMTMLETIREYALERLAASGEEEAVRLAHARYYLALAEAAEPALTSPQSEAWLAQLERDHDNFRAALRFVLDIGHDELALRLAGALARFWMHRGHLDEGGRLCEEALARSRGPAALRAKVLLGAALLAHDQVRFPQSRELFEQAIELARRAGDLQATALGLAGLAFVLAKQGEFATCDEMYAEAVAVAARCGDRWVVAHVGERRGTVLWMAGDHARAIGCFEDSLAAFKSLGDTREIAFVRASIGVSRIFQDGSGSALIEQALPTLREGNSPRYLAQALLYAGEARLARMDVSAARSAYGEVLEGLRPLGFVYGILMALGGLGRVAFADGQPVQAVRLLAAAEAAWKRIGALAPAEARRVQAATIENARAELDTTAFAAAQQAGRALTIEEAMDQAASVAAGPAAHGELTERETEIVRLVAEGLTNKQIAARLFLSVRTVHAHLRSIHRKLGVSSRAAAGRRAAELGLL